MKYVYAEDVNYWRTGQSSPDKWLDDAKREIKAAGGTVIGEAYGSEASTGRAAFMLEFEFGGERFRVVWPVLPTRAKNPAAERAARVQAATMLFHDVKARCVSAKVLGARSAFFSYLMLADGRTAAQAAAPELAALFPRLLTVICNQFANDHMDCPCATAGPFDEASLLARANSLALLVR